MQNVITKVAIVEDTQEERDHLVEIFREAHDFEMIGAYANGDGAINFLPRSDAKIVMVDIGMPGDINGIECVRIVKALRPDLQFMMYTVFDRDDAIFESLRAGASGYLLKTPDHKEILNAVRELINGGAPMSPHIAKKVMAFFSEGPKEIKELELLTKTELKILKLLAQGYLYKEIADIQNVVIGTIKQHIHNIYKKLHVSTRTEAINIYRGIKNKKINQN